MTEIANWKFYVTNFTNLKIGNSLWRYEISFLKKCDERSRSEVDGGREIFSVLRWEHGPKEGHIVSKGWISTVRYLEASGFREPFRELRLVKNVRGRMERRCILGSPRRDDRTFRRNPEEFTVSGERWLEFLRRYRSFGERVVKYRQIQFFEHRDF